ncbi:MAG: HIT domain-containing protein [Acidimicrobiia bacterium]
MLENLWAGWRRDYVESAVDGPGSNSIQSGPGSVFSRILASGLSDEATHIVWRGRRCFAIMNAYPYTNGHLLVMPYREIAALDALGEDEHDELWDAVRTAVGVVKSVYNPDGVNVGMNLGAAAGAGVPTHLHAHVLPRWNGDTNAMTAIAGVRVMPETLESSARRIREGWIRAVASKAPSVLIDE